MTNRSRSLFTAAVGLWVALPLFGQDPAPSGPSPNQQVADNIVERLRQSGQLHQCSVDVSFQDGTAEITGQVGDAKQRAAAVRIVGGVPGVVRVRDHMQIQAPLVPVQAVEPPMPLPQPNALPNTSLAPPPGLVPGMGTVPGEPMPVWEAPPPNPYDLNPPKMPPYAWPTYAPYNNYSRVAYPTLYPYNAWPFIGPVYPFPKVPPGWRKVSLEWQDGFWWYAPHSNSHDWWRLRYW